MPKHNEPKPSEPTTLHPSPATDGDARYRLSELASLVGKVDPRLRAALIDALDPTEMVEIGRRFDTIRIIVDGARLYGTAFDFWKQATPEQKKSLRGFTPPLLTVAVHELLALEQLLSAQRGKASDSASTRAQQESDGRQASTVGIALRDQAYSALRNAVGRDVRRRAQVDAALGTAKDGEALAAGLDGLAAVGAEWLALKDDAIGHRLSVYGVDASLIADLKSASARVQKTVTAALRKPAAGKVTQGQLDVADGVNLTLLDQIVSAFDHAHDIDPTIPRLIPISTRRFFKGGVRAKSPKAPKAEKTPAPAGTGGTPTTA